MNGLPNTNSNMYKINVKFDNEYILFNGFFYLKEQAQFESINIIKCKCI